MAGVLYSIIIRPLELFFQFVYGAAYGFIHNYGFSIIMLSLAINFLVLPLYRRADAIQNEEKDIQEKMSRWVTHIKKTFSGDERYMKLSTYYRQNHYSSIYALRGSISLFLQIPFFIAAYRFLSGYTALRGVSFGPIADLGAPDAMIHIFGLTLNLLPILMTLINFISSAIYTRGFPLKSKIQLYVIAIFFLVFLYRSPAGLVFYWTLNNLFSLVKNVFYKLKHPREVLRVLAAVTGIGLCLLEFTVFRGHTLRQKAFVLMIAVALMVPLLIKVAQLIIKKSHIQTDKSADANISDQTVTADGNRPFFLLGCLGLVVLTGLLIPSALIGSSAQEFVDGNNPINPASLLLQPVLVAFGLFVLWFGVFYSLATKKAREKLALGVFALLAIAVVNYMFFGKNLGTISADLVFDKSPAFSWKQQGFNLIVLLAVILVIWLIWKKKAIILRLMAAAVLIGLLGLSFMNINKINSSYKEMVATLDSGDSDWAPTIPLSKKGKNVMVIMLDRAIDGYIPYIMKEKPELMEKFSGFTYYPNTISYGTFTNFGAPALFGGYEYTPTAINARSDEKLVDKHNEALKVLPKLFSEEDYQVTIGDPPYAGYQTVPDLSIYDDLDNTNVYRFAKYTSAKDGVDEKEVIAKRKRNLFCYSVFKSSPLAGQHFLYNGGKYFAVPKESDVVLGDTAPSFIRAYSVLKNLENLTKIQDTDKNTLLLLANLTTHEQTELQKPAYKPAAKVDNTKYNADHINDYYTIDGQVLKLNPGWQEQHYDVNMAALIKLGEWFDYLKEQGVYDNTRIILVSDHGYGFDQLEKLKIDSVNFDAMWVNPLLMVKDFNADGFATSDEFMTNADIPYLTSEGLIKNAANPYTGNEFDPSSKEGEQTIVYSHLFDVYENNGTRFDTSDGRWFTVHDNLFDPKNWTEIEEPK